MNIINLLEDSYLQEHKERRKSTSWHPSGVSECVRKLYYKRTNTEESDPIEAGALMKMAFGTALHEDFQKRLTKELEKLGCINIQSEYEITHNDLSLGQDPIHGYIDMVWKDKTEWVGCEFKTSYGRGVVDVKKNGPKKEHLEQIFLYLELANVHFSRFYLVYVARDNNYRTEFLLDQRPVSRNLTWCCNGTPVRIRLADLMNRFIDVKKCVDAKTVPDRPYITAIKQGQLVRQFVKLGHTYKSDWQCSYCNYQTHCWKDEVKKYEMGDNSERFKESISGRDDSNAC